ncbi:PQQ-binding-like beta-propeller repeat protein [Galbibacter sp. BG1]|uniref:outer membrane protein assembly factor BamB family protein n=1 Tax=Galbibacter sp. BG1 TaxID=1170699 RepID=UPI0015BE0AF9|nr:PQQ-binding-like beta-propeller repeat protein [Galbibacter sp. BG1]QLE02462.1 PQQ-binding-like beta-propeller repeat protein [Galbibacter sp. BG1]
MKLNWSVKLAIIVLTSFSSIAQNNPENFISSGNEEIDSIRIEISLHPTNLDNALERKAVLYRWWRLLWRQGINLRDLDPIANNLINTSVKSQNDYKTIDIGFHHLEEIIRNPTYIKEVKGEPNHSGTTKNDWPFYHGTTTSQKGFSSDPGPTEGKISWKYPKTNGWDIAPVIENGKVYAAGAGNDVVAFCFDEKTGKTLWKGKQNSISYYNDSGAQSAPYISEDRVFIKTKRDLLVLNKANGKSLGKKELKQVKQKVNLKKPFPMVNNINYIDGIDRDTGEIGWRFVPDGLITGKPYLSDFFFYVTDFNGRLYMINRTTGKNMGSLKISESLRGIIGEDNQQVYVSDGDGKIIAVDKHSARQLWKFIPNHIEKKAFEHYSGGIIKNNKLYVGSANGRLYCIDTQTGKKLWEYNTHSWIKSKPVIVGNTIYAATINGMLFAITKDSGNPELKWKKKISDHGFFADLAGTPNGIVLTDTNMKMYSVNIENGKLQWKQSVIDGAWIDDDFYAADEISGQQSSPTIVDNTLYIAGPDGFLNAVDTKTGLEKWRFELKSSVSPSPTVAEGLVFVGQTYKSYGIYYALDKDTGEVVWSTNQFGNVWVAATYANGLMFVGNMNGDFFAFEPKTGKKVWSYFTGKNTPKERINKKVNHGHGWPPGVYCNPVTEGNVVYTGSWSGYYFAFDQKTGELLWRCKTQPKNTNGGLPDSAAPVLHKNYLYVQKAGRSIAAINKLTGKIEWEWQAPAGFLQNGTVAAHDNMIYGSAVRQVTTLPYKATIFSFSDVENGGEKKWEFRGGGGLTAPVIASNKLIFGSSADPFVTCINAENGKLLWRTHVGGMMLESVPSIYGNKVFALIKNGYLYAIQ